MTPGNDKDELCGAGEAAGGLVRATVGPDGLLERVRFNPRVMRLSSEQLAEHVVSAVRAAQQDRLGRVGESADGAEGAVNGFDAEMLTKRLAELEVQNARDFAQLTAALDETLRRIDGM